MGNIRFSYINTQDVLKEETFMCFSPIYKNVKTLKTIIYYVAKSYKDYPISDLSDGLSIEEIKKICLYLKRMGFVFEVDYNCETWHLNSEKYKNIPSISFTLDCEKNSNLSILILLNVFRFINESNMHYKLLLFLKLMQIKTPNISNFSKLLLADTLEYKGNSNHSMAWNSRSVFKNILPKNVKSTIIENPLTNITSVNANIAKIENYKLKTKLVQDMKKLMQQDKLTELLEYYEKKCS